MSNLITLPRSRLTKNMSKFHFTLRNRKEKKKSVLMGFILMPTRGRHLSYTVCNSLEKKKEKKKRRKGPTSYFSRESSLFIFFWWEIFAVLIEQQPIQSLFFILLCIFLFLGALSVSCRFLLSTADFLAFVGIYFNTNF